MKMWSGRFRQPLDPEFERWQRRLSSTVACCATSSRPAALMPMLSKPRAS